MSTPVSVLLPAFNAERFVAAAVRSVLAQTHRDFELIAIDDGSTDRTGEILEMLAGEDPRVRVISHPNYGMGRSLNEALEVAKHDWVARMDADDLMMPNRLERQLAFLAENRGLVVASSLVHYIDEDGNDIGRNTSPFTDAANVREAVADNRVVGFHHPAVMMRKQVIRDVGGYRPAFWPADDADLWNRVLERHAGVLVQPEYLMKYRIHGASACVASAREMTRKTEWVAACMRHRRAGAAEPSWSQFVEDERCQPWWVRLNRGRRDFARTLYKGAVYHFSKRRYTRFVSALACATVLEPHYVLPRVLPQITL
jgi:glycosyltransferase involved in cell wall biosynthesis